jgi:TPR repeat protein
MQFMFKLVLILLFSFQTAQASLSKGLDVAQAGDYSTAYELWLPMAKQGDAGAQFNVGLLHSKQLIDQASQEQAVKWYLLAANNDHVNAQFNLGIKYDNGLGVESLEWNMQGVSMYIAPSESVFGV